MTKTRIIVRENKETSAAPEKVTAEFDVEALLAKGGQILQREIQNLMIESSGKKLSPTSARDLVNFITLLHKMQLDQVQKAANMTDEELAKALSDAASQEEP